MKELDIYLWSKMTFVGHRFNVRPKVVCNDGFNISIQGNMLNYSVYEGGYEYSEMEIGFPSIKDEIMEGGDGDVRGFVPMEEINDMIIRHGGINEELTMKDCNTAQYKKRTEQIKLLKLSSLIIKRIE